MMIPAISVKSHGRLYQMRHRDQGVLEGQYVLSIEPNTDPSTPLTEHSQLNETSCMCCEL